MKPVAYDLIQEADIRNSVVNELLSINNWIKNKVQQELKPFGITLQQYRVLMVLEANPDIGLSTSQIKEYMYAHKSDISRMIERMVKKKLIIRKAHKQDKRLVDIRIGPGGEETLARLKAHSFKLENFISVLDNEDVENLNELLSKIKLSSSTN